MWKVRPETPRDLDSIRAVHRAAFPTAAEADLVDRLRETGALVPELCMVAIGDGELVGHIAFSRARLDDGPDILALAPMAVQPEHQGRGAGSALVRESLGAARSTEFPLVVVLGHADYYPRFGFAPAQALGVHAPFPVPPEAWMAHRLPAYTAAARGTVIYAAPFAELA
jgi:predicted N-acetyltransferase YhbS